MSRVFIDTFYCKTPCQIFTGKDALTHAIFWIETGRLAHEATHLYYAQFKFDTAIGWNKPKSSYQATNEISGCGNHMKLYEYKEYIIFGSQNNGKSSLFESALVFKKKPELSKFINTTIKRCAAYVSWWKRNKTY